ncbi:MAG: GNAT family N-acetyltransferase [Bacteroidota bacterium]
MEDLHTSFVFDLFLKREIPSFYGTKIKNGLSKETQLDSLIHRQPLDNPFILIKDVPDYLSIPRKENPNYAFKKIGQYKGLLVKLDDVETAQNYIEKHLSKKTLKRIFQNKAKLERDHEISYQMYFGEITKHTYDYLFVKFYEFLKKRFEELRIYNRYLLEWKSIYGFVFPLIKQKKASLFVVYKDEQPITIALNFHLSNMVLSHIVAFDLQFKKYGLGDINMLKHLEWCTKNNITIFDLSMGHTTFKSKWCNHEYKFDYHIFYEKSSTILKFKAMLLTQYLWLKQFLRNVKIIGNVFSYDKFFYTRQMKRLEGYTWHKDLDIKVP